MPTDTLKIKERLTARGNFTPEQADDIVSAFLQSNDPLVTETVLDQKLTVLDQKLQTQMSRQTVRILLGVVGINAALLAAFAYVMSLFLA